MENQILSRKEDVHYPGREDTQDKKWQRENQEWVGQDKSQEVHKYVLNKIMYNLIIIIII